MNNISFADFAKLVGIPEADLQVGARKKHLVHQAVKAEELNRRQGTVASKTRSYVRGGGRKPFKQKGTGSARQGSSRSPLMPGGGSNHGPQPRDWELLPNRKEQRAALQSILVNRLAAGRVFVLGKGDWTKSKAFRPILEQAGKEYVVLIGEEVHKLRGAKNFPRVHLDTPATVSVRDFVRGSMVVFENESVAAKLKVRLGLV